MTTKTADDAFERVKAKLGFVPNLIREMARSPAVAQAYLRGQDAMAQASLSGPEQQIVQLAVAVYNECPYCRAAHRAGCRHAGVAHDEIELVEKGALPDDRRLRSLVSATWQVLDTRGWLRAADLANLEAEGVDRRQLYEVVAFVGLKTISNYINHIAHTVVDAEFRNDPAPASDAS
jgi:AhpD family alkylhydroperoxidase